MLRDSALVSRSLHTYYDLERLCGWQRTVQTKRMIQLLQRDDALRDQIDAAFAEAQARREEDTAR